MKGAARTARIRSKRFPFRSTRCILVTLSAQLTLRWSYLALLLTGLASPVLAGGGPMNVAVVVNDNSADSLALGRYYCDQRGIPESHLVHVSSATSGVIAAAAFTNDIFQPLVDALTTRGLTGQVDTVVYCIGLPHAVSSGGLVNAITATTYYGFKTYPSPSVSQCTLPVTTANEYYDAEESFDFRDRSLDGIQFLSSLLTSYTLAEAKVVVDRSVAADGSIPAGTVHYVHTTDLARNVHWPQFEQADSLRRLLNLPVAGAFTDANFLVGKPNIVGYMIGISAVQQLLSNTFQPGALGDHLTSFGGVLTGTSQMEIVDWLQAGCVGSYGTVVEPCNYTNKFPSARLHYYYGRGFSMAESYAMAVANPYMGLVVGDPLCAPFAVAPAVEIGGVTPGEVVSGTIAISATGTSGGVVQELDLFLDDRFFATVTNAATDVGDQLSVTVNGDTRMVTAPAGAPASQWVELMATALNLPPALPVTASAKSDRLDLIRDVPGVSGTGMTYAVAVSSANLAATASGAHLLDPVYPARRLLSLSGTPRSGNSISLSITPLTGPAVVHQVFRQAGDEVDDLMVRLQTAVNQDTNLQASTGCEMKYMEVLRNSGGTATDVEVFLVARTNHWSSYNIQIDYEVNSIPAIGMTGPEFIGPLSSNADVLRARGAVFVSVGRTNLAGSVQLDTTLLPDGPHSVRALAYEGSAVRTQGAAWVPFVVSNHTLRCSLRTPGNGNAFLVGQDVLLESLVSGGAGVVTSVEFMVEGKVDEMVAAAPFTNHFSTAAYGVGAMGLQALVRNDAGEAALSARIEIHLLDPTDGDGDGLPDGWELFHFASTNTTDGTIDSDGDDQNDFAEFVADTDPDDPASRFEILDFRASDTDAEIEFVSSPTRKYTVEFNAQGLTNEAAWQGIETVPFSGSPNTSSVLDTNAQSGADRNYRVRVFEP